MQAPGALCIKLKITKRERSRVVKIKNIKKQNLLYGCFKKQSTQVRERSRLLKIKNIEKQNFLYGCSKKIHTKDK